MGTFVHSPEEITLNLHHYMVTHPVATFFMRAEGDNPSLGIYSDDILVIDRSLQPKPSSLVVAFVNGELKIDYWKNILSTAEVWGVITYVVHKTV